MGVAEAHTGIADRVNELAREAAAASAELRGAPVEQRDAALRAAAARIRTRSAAILDANARDLAAARAAGRDDAFVDRLALDADRVCAIADAVDAIADLDDPLGRILHRIDRPNGLIIERVSVPIGVIGMIYESRPNVSADASALCIKSGNAVVLRGGSEAQHSNAALADCMRDGLAEAGLPRALVQRIDTTDREAVSHLLRCVESIDLVIPRGGRGLVERIVSEAKVPTLWHLDGNCHTYVHSDADMDKAIAVVRNAKLRRTGICGATESLVVDESIAAALLPMLIDAMAGCEFRGDDRAQACDSRVVAADDADWGTEYLAPIVSVRTVDDIDAAIAHVSRYSSGHTEAIITENRAAADRFMAAIDSAIVMHNASTQFADGGEFGMGAEIGIATGKLHARGPVGVEQLTTYKYRVLGDGQIRA